MGNKRRNAILKGLVFALAFAMLIPVTTGAMAQSETTDMYLVYADTPGLNAIRGSGMSIAKDYGSFILTSMSQGVKDQLAYAGFNVQGINNNIEFSTVSFNTRDGPSLPSNLKGTETGYYVVQFIGPVSEDWKAEVQGKGAKLFSSVNNNAFVMKMNPSVKNAVGALPYVNWVGNYEPAYKLADGIGASGIVSLDVRTFNGEDFNTVLGQIKGLGASVRYTTPSQTWSNSIVLDIAADKVDDIAQLPQVVSIVPWSVPQLMNDQAVSVTDADLAWYPDTSGVDATSNTWGGLTGYNQVVGVLDSGFDTGLATSGHYDWFLGPLGDRVLRVQRTSTTGTVTADYGEYGGHGTHCAGIVGGNGYCSEQYYGMNTGDHIYGGDHVFAGQAPECLLSFDACGDPAAEGVYPDIPLAYQRELADGAYIHSNSWGGTNNAYSSGQTVDQFMWDNRNNLVIFAAGNAGPTYGTIGDGATAKNDLTVGACGNDRPSYKFASDPGLIVSFSSRGPEDGRNEPDIMAPGEYIASTHAVDSQHDPTDQDGDGNIYNDPFCGEDLKINVYPAGTMAQWDYCMMSGTSMACPATAGNAALVRQYFVEQKSTTPSGIMMKAALLHGTQDMGFGFPSNDQGWGRLSIKDSLFPAAPATWQYYDHKTGIATGTTWYGSQGGFNLNVASGRVPLKVTLVWLDYPGTTSSALLNNMNLVVRSPTGTNYLGNVFSGGYSTTGGTADTVNTVEKTIIANPGTGIWNISVVGAALPNGPIPFAIMVSADFGPQTTYKVEMTAESPVVFSCVAGGSTTFNFNLLNFGSAFDTIALSQVNLPTGVTVTYTSGTSVGLASNSDRDISATILVGGTVASQVYEFSIKGTSTKDTNTPPTQDKIDLKMEVLSMATATRTRVTSALMSEKSPTIVTYDGATTDYIFIAYFKYDEAGPHIYLRYSTDDMATWTERQAHLLGDGPSEPRMIVLPENSPDHPLRVLIFYAGWDPADETSGSWVRVCRADPPYTTWTNTLLMDNVGADTTNSLRRVSPCVVQPGEAAEEILVAVESIGTTSVTQIYQQYSQTGGDTWAYTATTETKVPGQLTTSPNFFPEVGIDQDGSAMMVWYCSDGDRDIHYKRYNAAGAWVDAAYPTVTGLAVAGQQEYEPCLWSTPEGTNTNRMYVGCMRSSVSPPEAPFTTYLVYTDNPDAAPPTWAPATAYGSFSTDASQSDYPSGKPLIQGNREGTGRSWFTFSEEANIYGTPQPHAAHSITGYSTWSKYYITADAIGKDHLTSDSLGNYMYSAFGAAYEPGNTDIWVAKYGLLDAQRQADPTSVTDSTGPLTKNVGCTPNPTSGATTVTLTATVDDSTTGFRNIQAARYYSSRDATVRAMTAMDGSFNSVIEGVTASVSVSGWPAGDHTIYVSGQDIVGNWGAYVSYTLTVSANSAPGFGGVYKVVNPGTGALYLNSFWDPADDPNTPITYRLCRWTTSPSSAQITTAFSGSAWIYSGTALTYNDTAVTLGTTYYYVCRAYDALGAFDTNEVIRSATVGIEWFLQTSASVVAGYNEMNLDPMDDQTTYDTAALGTVGEVQISTEWMSDPMTVAKDVAGLWTFKTYGYASGTTVHGNMYAKVYKDNGATLMFTTGYDDEDIASFTTTHLFIWTYTAGANTVNAGDSISVEFWIHVTSTPGNTVNTWVTNPSFDASATGWTGLDWTSYGTTYNTETWVATGGNPNGLVNVRISGATTNIGTVSRGGFWQYPFTTTTTPTAATVSFDWVCSEWTGLATNLQFLVFVDSAAGDPTMGDQDWSTSVTAITTWASVTNVNVLSKVAAPGTYYLKIAVFTDGYGRNDAATGAFDNVQLTTSIYAPHFSMVYDGVQTPSSVLPTLTNAVATPPYAISLTGKTANSWVFISFPSGVTGTIETLLTDLGTGGDGLTTWTIAKWYNPATPTDPWKTYRTGGTANDMPTVNNQMGFWLYITANGGDQALTLSTYSAVPASTVISLAQGWNLVGYPSSTDRSGTTTPAQVTTISVYSASAAYTDRTDKSLVTLHHGNAYFMYANAATTWTVTNP